MQDNAEIISTLLKSIKSYCKNSCRERKGLIVNDCPFKNCSLWFFRLGKTDFYQKYITESVLSTISLNENNKKYTDIFGNRSNI